MCIKPSDRDLDSRETSVMTISGKLELKDNASTCTKVN